MIRKGNTNDIPAIMEIIADAQSLLASRGVDQWQDGYPTADIIAQDIARAESYVIEIDRGVAATAVISFAGEPTYSEIKGRGWLNGNPYAVVHRIAVSDKYRRKGIAKEILHFAEELCAEQGFADIRIDTHCDNRAMRSLLKKMGYTHCGKITLTSGASREAYQKKVEQLKIRYYVV